MFRGKAEKKVREAGYDPARLPAGPVPDREVAGPPRRLGRERIPPISTGWDFRVSGEVDTPVTLTWQELNELPTVEVTQDIHCVTRWSRFDTTFAGIPWSALRELVGQRPTARFAIAHAEAGFTLERAGRVPRARGRDARDPCRRRAADRRARLAAAARSSRASTSGRAPSGCAGSSCGPTTSRASGSGSATTTRPTRSRSSASGSEPAPRSPDRGTGSPGSGR